MAKVTSSLLSGRLPLHAVKSEALSFKQCYSVSEALDRRLPFNSGHAIVSNFSQMTPPRTMGVPSVRGSFWPGCASSFPT